MQSFKQIFAEKLIEMRIAGLISGKEDLFLCCLIDYDFNIVNQNGYISFIFPDARGRQIFTDSFALSTVSKFFRFFLRKVPAYK